MDLEGKREVDRQRGKASLPSKKEVEVTLTTSLIPQAIKYSAVSVGGLIILYAAYENLQLLF